MRVNIFTADLDVLFKLKGHDLAEELAILDQEYKLKSSMRAGRLLTWFYLLGSYSQPAETRNWDLSLHYLSEMVNTSESDDPFNQELTRGSSHNSLLLFLLQQHAMIEDFNYFQSQPEFLARVIKPSYIKRLVKQILYDSTSQTNKALVVNSYYMCTRLKKIAKDHNLDVNKIWKSTNVTNGLLLGQIPFINQCEKCSEELLEIAHEESYNSIEYMQVEAETFMDLFNGPDQID